LSWRKSTVSFPTSTFLSPLPMVTKRIGGAAAAASWAFASSVTSGQAASSACLAANFMAKARQVGYPHSLQLVLGKSL